MTTVKICGLRRVEDALAAAEAGADMLGFVFAPSRRRIEPEAAREIIVAVKRRHQVLAVGVFVNASASEMNRIAELCDLDYLQLSGDEDAALVPALRRPAIKALHVGPKTSAGSLARRAAETEAAVIMLDTGSSSAYGGTGTTFDWTLVPAIGRPVLLAGGLDPENVSEAIQLVKPWGVDVSSGVETDGEKDQAKIRAFLRAVASLGDCSA